MLRKNELCTLAITELNNLGFGVARWEGQLVFVSGAVDGDTVEARILRVFAGYAVAKTEKILAPSPHRITPACTVRGCGGCVYQAVDYAHEREVKRQQVVTAFAKAGLRDAVVGPLKGTGILQGYRNKAQYPVSSDGKGGYRIGFYAPKTHRVVEGADCMLQPACFAQVLEVLRAYFTKYHLPAYVEEEHSGLIRHVYLRASSGGGVLVVLVLNGDRLPAEEELVASLRAAVPGVVGVWINTNRERTNVICGPSYRLLWGQGYVEEVLAGVKLHIPPASFFQVNRDAAEILYARAADLANLSGEELLLDLYCGVGSIGLSMASRVREVIGIEIVPQAVEYATENARLNGITNASFYCGDAADTGGLLARAEQQRGSAIRPDVVVLDPPRKGCDAGLLDWLGQLSPSRIVYISCNPVTLARDAAHLVKFGYRLSEVTPVDLFPRTMHVESVVLLSGK